MARTISVSSQGPGLTDDLDGTIVDGLEALKQRITEAVRFRFGTWFLNISRGLDYNFLIGHKTAQIVSSVLTDLVLEEGGNEILSINSIEFSTDRAARTFTYYLNAQTIYGDLAMTDSEG